jgi:predicted phage tail protein
MSEPKVRNIRLYGKLGAKFGRCFRMAVSNTAEAVQALSAQLPGFEEYLLTSKDRGMNFACFIGDKNIGEEELKMNSSEKDIRIAPVMTGSKKGGFLQVIMGAILVVVGVVFTAFGNVLGPALINMGVSMMIGGIIQLLTPQPKGRKRDDDQNYSFSGPINTSAQGNPVPLAYGRIKAGSAVISAGIYTADNASAGGTGSTSGTGGGQYNSTNETEVDWIENEYYNEPV